MAEPSLTLVSHDLCPYVQRSVITLLEKRVPHERIYIDLGNKPDWFLDISPLGKVPLLKTNGSVLFESAVICEYLDETTPGTMHPADTLEKARHRSWIEFGSALLNAIAEFYNAKDEAGFAKKQQAIADRLTILDDAAAAGPYFAGSEFHLIDAAYGPIFRYFDVFEDIADFGFFEDSRNLNRWRKALRERPSVRNAVVSDYPQRLKQFLLRRNSHLSTMVAAAA